MSINFKVIDLTRQRFKPARFRFPDLPKTGDGRFTHLAIPSNRYCSVARPVPEERKYNIYIDNNKDKEEKNHV